MRSKNRALNILLFTNSLILIAGAMLGPIYAIFVEKIGGDLMDASVAGAVFALVAGFVSLLSGFVSDKVKENEFVLIAGYFLIALGFLSYLFISSVIGLFITQAIIGLGEAIYSPAFDALYSKHMQDEVAGKEWGKWESMNYFSSALGADVGGVLASQFGFDMLFIAMASISFLSALYILLLDRKVL